MNTDEVGSISKYREGWVGGLPETPCGYGSKVSSTREQRKWLPGIFSKYNIRSIADVGAGDLNWIKSVNMSGIEYIPLDLVPRDDSVAQFDIRKQVPPKADAVMCLWVLNHLPFDDCREAIRNLRASGAKYLIMTDRPKLHPHQPPEIKMQSLEALRLNDKGDRIKFIRL